MPIEGDAEALIDEKHTQMVKRNGQSSHMY